VRSERRKVLDEQIAAEAHLPIPDLPANTPTMPLEDHLKRLKRRPVAVFGIVENGIVRPLDPTVHLEEKSRVIIVAAKNLVAPS